MNPTPLFADFQALALESLTASETQVILVSRTIQPTASCPGCAQSSSRIHSHYQRSVTDLPWQGVRVQLQLLSRRFFCVNPSCLRRIFCERLPQVVAAYGRQTIRFNRAIGLIGLMLGGQAGAKLARELSLFISPDTLLRRIYQSLLPATQTPRVLGVDDWAYRKRFSYGTLLVDLETRKPVALLPEREAKTLSQWLAAHPGVEVMTRDRSLSYKQGATQGAPEAIQVADRFHLLQNLAETLEQIFSENIAALRAYEATLRQTSAVVSVPPPAIEPADYAYAQQSRARRQAIYQQVWELHACGWTRKAIAQHLGIGVRSIYRYLHSHGFAERKERKDRGQSHLDPYKPYLIERWNRGCHQAKVLFEDLKAQGCQTSYGSVCRYVRCLKAAQGLPKRGQNDALSQDRPVLVASRQRPLTPRSATWLVLRPPHLQARGDEQRLTQLQAQSPDLETAIPLAQAFAQMVRNREPGPLDSWLEQAMHSHLRAFVRFAKGLYEDYDAVKAGLTLPWSNGQVEGHINRLKMVKRQMYGRAGIELLSRRFLLTS